MSAVATNPPALVKLLERVQSRTAVIGVIGLGYVGLPLCHTFHDKGFTVHGFDVDERRVRALNDKECYLPHAQKATQSLTGSDRFKAYSDMSHLAGVDVAIICVPTPVGKHLEPDLSYILGAGAAIAASLHAGQLVVLESTTYPGTTDEELRQVLDEAATKSQLSLGTEYFLAFSPEREDPGNTEHSMHTIPKLVGGVEAHSLAAACAVYGSCFAQVCPVSSTRVAESAKLVENIYRAVNIALVNELKIIFEKMDVDIWEVLDAAATKPFGFNRFNPGAGWGGHCIPVDPFYLTWRAKAVGATSHFIERAGEINTQMPHYVVERVQKALNGRRKPLNGSRILLLGVAYKPNIADTRETPAFVIWELLRESGSEVFYHDSHVPEIADAGHHAALNGQRSLPLDTDTVCSMDAVIVVTHHKDMDFEALRGYTGCVIDTRNCIPKDLGVEVTKA